MHCKRPTAHLVQGNKAMERGIFDCLLWKGFPTTGFFSCMAMPGMAYPYLIGRAGFNCFRKGVPSIYSSEPKDS